MQGRFIVSVIQRPLVGGEEGQKSSDVGAGQDGEPFNLSADVLVGGLALGEVGVVRVRIGYGFDGAA